MRPEKVYPFKRGATFKVLLELPESFALDYFEGWEPRSQIRRRGHDGDKGYISDLDFAWVDEGVSRQFTLAVENTEYWPLGEAEVDVVFTSPSPDYFVVTSSTIYFDIKRNITR